MYKILMVYLNPTVHSSGNTQLIRSLIILTRISYSINNSTFNVIPEKLTGVLYRNRYNLSHVSFRESI